MTGGVFLFLRSFTREPQERGSCALNPLEFHDVETREHHKKNEKKKSPGECFETGLDGFVTEANASQDRSDILGGSCLNTTF